MEEKLLKSKIERKQSWYKVKSFKREKPKLSLQKQRE